MSSDDEAPSPRAVLVVGGLFEAAIVLAAFGLGALLGTRPLATLLPGWRDALIGVAAAVPMFLAFVAAMRAPSGPFRNIRQALDAQLVPMFRRASVGDVFGVSALAGIGEELLFRGVVQAYLATVVGPVPALVVASATFGFAHLITPTYAAVAAVLGCWLGFTWIATGNLLVPIVAHAVYDFAGILFLLREGRTAR